MDELGCAIFIIFFIIVLIIGFSFYLFIEYPNVSYSLLGIIIFSLVLYFVIREINLNKKHKLFEKERKRFGSSNSYKYLENFVSKYKTIIPSNIAKLKTIEDKIIKENITKLKTLIDKKGFNFDNQGIKKLIDIELRAQKYKDFKTKILYNDPKDLEDYVKNLIEIYGENYKVYTGYLRNLLEEKGFDKIPGDLIYNIYEIKDKLELKQFEKGLESKDLSFVYVEEVDSFTGYEFEHFLNVLFKKMGYSVESTKLSGDQGADLIISKLGEKVILQAKRHKAKIGNKAVQEVVASIKHYNADKGMVVTNNYFTNSAFELAKSNNIELIDRDKLEELIVKYL